MSTGSASAAVRTRGLHKYFGRIEALKGIDPEVPVGSVFGIIGPNGAGKTTLMRLLLDLLRPSSGAFGTGPLSTGSDWAGLGALYGASALLVLLAAFALTRRDIGT